jgi:hypothetical protein
MGRVPRRGRLTVRGLALAVAVAGAGSLLSACGAARDAADDRVDQAVQDAQAQADAAVQQQARDALDDALSQVDGASAVCSSYAALSDSDRTAAMGGILQAFWFADLTTEAPSSDMVDAYVADVDARCAADPSAVVTAVAQDAYDSGSYSPPE